MLRDCLIVPSLSNGHFRAHWALLVFVTWITAVVSLPLLPELLTPKSVESRRVGPGSSGMPTNILTFADSANRGFIGKGTDSSDALAQGAPLVMCYDPMSSHKSAAAECSGLQ